MAHGFLRLGFALFLLSPWVVANAVEPLPVGGDGVQHVEMLAGSYFFQPDHLVVKANVPVEILVRKEAGMVPHTFVLHIPEDGIGIDQEQGAEAKPIRFTIHRAGRYEFYCRNRLLFFESHRAKGMQGIIEVVE